MGVPSTAPLCGWGVGREGFDSLYNDFLFMWEELTGKSGRRLTEMIGKRYTRTQLIFRVSKHFFNPQDVNWVDRVDVDFR